MTRPTVLGFAVILAIYGCADGEPGYATVQGNATQDGGGPVINSALVINCGGGAIDLTTATDSVGHYAANLTSQSGSGQLQCSFRAPNATAPVSGRDTTIGFGRGNQPHAIQVVDLLPMLVR